MSPRTLAALLLSLLWLLPALGLSTVSRCSQEPEIPRMFDILWKDESRSSRFLYDSRSAFKRSTVCQKQEKDRSKVFDVPSLVSLVTKFEEERECLFGETEWTRLKENLNVTQGQSQRITEEYDPDIYVIPNFLTPRQCQRLVDLYEKIGNSSTKNGRWIFSTTKQLLNAVYKASLSPNEYNVFVDSSKDCDGGMLEGVNIGEKLAKVLNYSSSVLVPRGESAIVDRMEKHIQQVIGLPRTNAFHTQLLKYRTNSEYKEHTDCHAIKNDRMATIIIYLTDVDEGGETIFPFLRKSIKPKRGMAVVWKNLNKDGECDVKTTHVAGRVNEGEKYVYQKWFYENPILPQYQNSDFTLCDLSQSCRQYIYNKSTTIAVQYMNKGQESAKYIDAVKYYELALRHQPLHAASLVLYADALNKLGYSRQALSPLLSLLKMHPRNKDAIEVLKSVVESFVKN